MGKCPTFHLLGGQLSGGQLSGGQLSGGQLSGGQLSGGQLSYTQKILMPKDGNNTNPVMTQSLLTIHARSILKSLTHTIILNSLLKLRFDKN